MSTDIPMQHSRDVAAIKSNTEKFVGVGESTASAGGMGGARGREGKSEGEGEGEGKPTLGYVCRFSLRCVSRVTCHGNTPNTQLCLFVPTSKYHYPLLRGRTGFWALPKRRRSERRTFDRT
jgi:hypothetical protein